MKRISITISVFSLCIGVAAAQTVPGNVTVQSDPPGAEVKLKGDATLVGVTPTVFNQLLVGTYEVEINKPGYETYQSRVVVDPSIQTNITADLTPKTKLKSAIRSTFIPGWGQHYTEQHGKGWLLNFLAVGSVTTYFIIDHNFDQKYDDYVFALEQYDEAVASGASRTELERLLDDLEDKQEEAYDYEDIRRVTIGAVVGVWALSILDALLVFPYEHSNVSIRSFDTQSSSGAPTPGIQVTLRF